MPTRYPWVYVSPQYRFRLPQNEELSKAIAGIVRRRREELHYTQEAVAKALSVPVSALSKIESSSRPMRACEFIKLCLILGLDLSEFYQREKI
jgi:transcriptional regulator with XRE-family HTH domain